MTEPELFVETASRIGRRLAATALWDGDACAWPPGSGGHARGDLYRGSAGIALFLAELARATGAAELRRASAGAARHAVRWAAPIAAAHPGLFNGGMGVAWAAAHAGAVLGSDEHASTASRAVRQAAENAPTAGNEVIDGAAGVMLGLLLLAPFAPGDDAAGTAVRWGEVLVARAVPEVWGWSWPAEEPGYVRNLLGYAHGASGIGHALLELAAASGRSGFRYAAEQAFLYERRFHRPELGNWPDFRYPAADVAPGGERAPAPYHPRFRTAWCHGATGIGLARVRAAELLRTPVYAAEARSAVGAARGFARGPGSGFSLCHGTAGTLELLAEASRLEGDPRLLAEAVAIAAEACGRFERPGETWPCGKPAGGGEPGLMLGEAGIGLTLLRLAGAGAPSVVLPRPAGAASAPPDGGGEAARLSAGSVHTHFGAAISALRRVGVTLPPPPAGGATPGVRMVERALRAAAAAEPDPARSALLADALAPELAAFELALGAVDSSEEAWHRGGADEPAWDGAWISLAATARLVETAHDWGAWRDQPEPPAGPAAWLVTRVDDRARVHRLAPFAAAVLAALRPARTLAELVGAVASGFSAGSAPAPERLREAVAAQLRALWRLGAIRADPDPPLESALRRLAAAAAGSPPPAAVLAAATVARQVESAAALLDAGDPLLAHVVALTSTAELEAALHAVHARLLFATELRAVHEAASPPARLAAFRALLLAVGRAFETDEVWLAATTVA